MINRDNYKLVKKFLDYRAEVLQNDPQTVRSGWSALRHVLDWADDRSFSDAHKIRPTLPAYVLTSRVDGKTGQLSPARMEKILSFARNLFEWLRIEHPTQFKGTTMSWISTLRVRRANSSTSRLIRRKFWTVEDVVKVLDCPTMDTLKFRRDKAALAFCFLSGMRGAAFVSMPVRSVDLDHARVYQLPEWGVKTKNSKAAITFLLPIPRLMEAVREWDTYVRSVVSSDKAAWYTRISSDGISLKADDFVDDRKPYGRRSALFQGLKELCELAGVEWKSPHKIRHGHGVYGLKRAKTMADYKALSQNMMHENLTTTDGIYSVLIDDEVGDAIATFKP